MQLNFPSVPVKSKVIERLNIREAVLDHVTESNADLVVLGTRGKNGLRELLMGTTAERIVAYAPCSVFAIKPEPISPDSNKLLDHV
jgi:universal stress protein E